MQSIQCELLLHHGREISDCFQFYISGDFCSLRNLPYINGDKCSGHLNSLLLLPLCSLGFSEGSSHCRITLDQALDEIHPWRHDKGGLGHWAGATTTERREVSLELWWWAETLQFSKDSWVPVKASLLWRKPIQFRPSDTTQVKIYQWVHKQYHQAHKKANLCEWNHRHKQQQKDWLSA